VIAFANVLVHEEPAAIKWVAAFGAAIVREAAEFVIALRAEDGKLVFGKLV
jgi:hypothetical protein